MAMESSNGESHVSTKSPPEPSPLRNANSFQENMRILVIGGAKFIGSHLVGRLIQIEKNEADGLFRLREGENTRLINIGNPGEFPMLELAETFKEIIHPKVKIVNVENTLDDHSQRKPDITKAKELFGWEPKIKLRDDLPLMEDKFRARVAISKE